MNRLILALALTPALFTTGAFAQTVSDDVSKQLWCGEALVVAFSNPPPGVPSEQLTQAQGFIDSGNKLIDDASQKYLDARLHRRSPDQDQDRPRDRGDRRGHRQRRQCEIQF